MMKQKQGQIIMIKLLMLFMTVAVTIALMPALKEILDVAQQSDNLNCKSFDYDKNGVIGNSALDYNSTLATESLGCMAIKLYLPYILLVVLIGGIAKLLYSNPNQNIEGGF